MLLAAIKHLHSDDMVVCVCARSVNVGDSVACDVLIKFKSVSSLHIIIGFYRLNLAL